jgi:hypothetical protein
MAVILNNSFIRQIAQNHVNAVFNEEDTTMSEAQTGNLQTSRGQIVNVNVIDKQGPKGPYQFHEFTLNTGKTFKLFGSIKSGLPSLDKKDVEGLEVGADVVIAESRNGKFLNVIGVDVLPSGTPTLQKSTTIPNTINVPTNQTATVSHHPQISDRDASIVIQAITKSLLEGAGNLYISTSSDGKYLNLNDSALSQHVQKILELHDRLVAERTGS